ncbi:MAG TPA: BON domain-containing protein [Bacteriovoracaceae bacterium]|nr:BON domain-containing protein [Bacteriovoracaceae bacterium]
MVPAQRQYREDDFEPHMSSFYNDFEEIDDDFVDEDEEEQTIHRMPTSDETMEDVIRELIHNSRRLDGDDITVSVHNADVTLSGKVRSEDEKYTAGSLVQLIHGVSYIKNDIKFL